LIGRIFLLEEKPDDPDVDAQLVLVRAAVEIKAGVSSEICTLREQYADLLEQDEEFPEAARVLIGIPLESGTSSSRKSRTIRM
jgi:hypothetical protein